MDGLARSLGDSISHLFDNATAAIGAAISGMVASVTSVVPPALLPVIGIGVVILVLVLVLRR